MRKPLSSYHPVLYWLSVQQRRTKRHLEWYFSKRHYSTQRSDSSLPYRHYKHTSKLIRKLGTSEQQWQINKVTNLKLAASCISGIIIAPNEYFSFCKLVGKPTRKRGFLEGMELSGGEARAGVGGGICQLSNLIHWMALHSPLQVIERANHSFDPFPDEGRVLPFGSGAAIFYNYIDLVLYNPTQQAFQIKINFTDTQLEGELFSSKPIEYKYHIIEKQHAFYQQGEDIYRTNEIWQEVVTKGHNPQVVSNRLLYKNNVRVKYAVDTHLIKNRS